MGNILDGKALARKLKDELKVQVEELRKQTGHVPHLVNVLIGDSHDACAYANSQKRVAEYIGINYELKILPENITQNELVETIQQLNHDTRVHGIMLHKPVPESINYAEVANSVNTSKDLEGVNITNIGKMMLGKTELIPCTPASIMEHIKSSGVDIRGKEAVVVGDSEIVGKPVSLLLLKEEATVTICHVATSQAGRLKEHVGRAEILVVAVGKAGLITGDMIKEGAIVVDVGINSVNGKIVGDVDFDSVSQKASYITPVPGGVGPVTVIMLMRNGIEAFKNQVGLEVTVEEQ